MSCAVAAAAALIGEEKRAGLCGSERLPIDPHGVREIGGEGASPAFERGCWGGEDVFFSDSYYLAPITKATLSSQAALSLLDCTC